MSTTVLIIIIFGAMLFAGCLSGIETAYSAANKMHLRKAAEEGDKISAMTLKIAENFAPSLSALLIGNNLANVASSAAMTLIFIKLYGNKWDDAVITLVSTVLMTLIALIIGDIIPKAIAKRDANRMARFTVVFVKVLTIILYPLVFIIMLLIRGLRKIWGKDKDETGPTVTEDDLSTIIDTVEEEGVIDEEKSELLQSTLDFQNTIVEEIMTPRVDMVYMDIDAGAKKKEQIIDKSRYSRIPVFEDTVDNIIGILYLNHYYKAKIQEEHPNIRKLLIKPCFVHKTMKLPAALSLMRERKIHMAIVTDEFGGTMGMVTMEDILEELVGDIWDETDVIVREIVKSGENTYDVSVDMNIDDFFEEIGFEPHDFECEYSTVGGWAVEMLNADPHVGDSFTYENIIMVVTSMKDMRVKKLTALVNPPSEDKEETE